MCTHKCDAKDGVGIKLSLDEAAQILNGKEMDLPEFLILCHERRSRFTVFQTKLAEKYMSVPAQIFVATMIVVNFFINIVEAQTVGDKEK